MDSRRKRHRDGKGYGGSGRVVSSTPQGSPATSSAASSPSVSSIGNDEAPMEINESGSEDLEIGLEQTFSDLGLDLDTTVRREKAAKNIKWIGFWKSLEPRNQDRLIYNVLKHPETNQVTVSHLMKTFLKRSKQNAILAILQLFLDLSGFKTTTINTYYKFDEVNSREVVSILEPIIVKEQKDGKFLFMKCTKFNIGIDFLVTKFLNELVEQSFTSGVLFDDLFNGHIFEFINCMLQSQKTPMFVTGFILAAKFCTTLLPKLTEKAEHFDIITKFLDFLLLKLEQNCLIGDRKCYPVKIVFCQEYCNWVKKCPELLKNRPKCLNRLKRLICDEHHCVRLTALKTCEALINSKEIPLHPVIDTILKEIVGRAVDVNFTVAIKAVDIMTVALEEFSDKVKDDYILGIIKRIFEDNDLLAKAAGRFVAAYLRQSENNDDVKILGAFCKIPFLQEDFKDRVLVLVEACIEYIPQLKQWNLIIDMLLNEGISFDAKARLLLVLNATLKYVISGERFRSEEPAEVNDEDNSDFSKKLIPNFESLLTVFKDDKNCLNRIVECLGIIKYDSSMRQTVAEHINTFWLLKNIFCECLDRVLLKSITDVFFNFDGKLADIGKIVGEIKTECSKSFGEISEHPKDEPIAVRFKGDSRRLAVLFEKFNLCDVLKWDYIFPINNQCKLICCKWYLVWKLRELVLNSSIEDINPYLHQKNCQDFVHTCVTFLQTTSSKKFLVFEVLAEFYYNFYVELRRKKQFSHLLVKLTDEQVDDLKTFIVSVIENRDIDLDQRQSLLMKFIEIVFIEVVPVTTLTVVLQYYNSHFEDFKHIFGQILSQLYTFDVFGTILILHTLTRKYEDILARYNVVDPGTSEAQELQLLTKRFLVAKELHSQGALLKLLNAALEYARRHEKNYTFLYFARYIVKKLKEPILTEAKNLFRILFKDIVPNNIVLLFGETFKNAE